MKTTGLLACSILCTGLFAAQPAFSQWTTSGPGTGGSPAASIEDLATTGATVYAASFFDNGSPGGLFRTTDNGQTWTSLEAGSCRAVAYTSSPAATVFAGNQSVLVRGGPNGPPWTVLNSNGHPKLDIKVVPGTSTIYVGSDDPGGLLLKYPEPGSPVKRTGLPAQGTTCSVPAIAIDPSTALPTLTLYAGVNVGVAPDLVGTVYKSIDGAEHWSLTGFSTDDVKVNDLALDGSVPGTVYLGTSSGLYKTADGGSTWVASNNGITNPALGVRAVMISPANHLSIYAGVDTKIYQSVDGAANWSDITGNFAGSVRSIASDPGGTVVHVGDSSGKLWDKVLCCGCA